VLKEIKALATIKKEKKTFMYTRHSLKVLRQHFCKMRIFPVGCFVVTNSDLVNIFKHTLKISLF
jgi:hypothetical protein